MTILSRIVHATSISPIILFHKFAVVYTVVRIRRIGVGAVAETAAELKFRLRNRVSSILHRPPSQMIHCINDVAP
jgi:hypothetical protein